MNIVLFNKNDHTPMMSGLTLKGRYVVKVHCKQIQFCKVYIVRACFRGFISSRNKNNTKHLTVCV